MRRAICLAAVAAVFAGVASACSDAPVVGSSPSVTAADAAVLEGSGPDAASIKARPELCAGLTRGGPVVEEFELPGEPAPPVGGVVVPGTYDLIEADGYRGSAPVDAGDDDSGREPPTTVPTGRAIQATLVIGEFSMSTVEARGASGSSELGPESTFAVLYRVEGASLVETAVCPKTALPVARPFSVVGNGFVLFPDLTHRELYLRRD